MTRHAQSAFDSHTSGEPRSVTLRPKQLPDFKLLLISLAFVAVGVWLIIVQQHWAGYASVALFSLGIVVSMIPCIPGASFLHLDEDGFTCCMMFRKHFTAWLDVQEFFLISMPGNKMVGFNFTPQYDRSRALRILNSAVADAERAIHGGFGMKIEDQLTLLRQWHEQAITKALDQEFLSDGSVDPLID